MVRAGIVWVLGAMLSVSTVGCGGTAEHPEDVMDSYVDHVRARRADEVYAMLGEEVRGDLSAAEFRGFFAENYDEILAQAEQIEQAVEDGRTEVSAALPIGEHGELALVFEREGWRLTEDVPAVAGATSPRGTLSALSAAVETQDLDGILRLLSKEKSDTLRAELNILRSGLAGVDEDDVVVTGDTATVYLDWGLRLELVLENGAWRLHRLTQQ